MMPRSLTAFLLAGLTGALAACERPAPSGPTGGAMHSTSSPAADLARRIAQYTPVRLVADTAGLTPHERRMLPILIAAAREMDGIYWEEAWGNRDSLLSSLPDSLARRYAEINYGPWDRLADDSSFVAGVGPKPKGANFYPHDLTAAELDSAAKGDTGLKSQYTLVRRDSAGRLVAVPYHVAFKAATDRAAAKLREAAKLADDPGLRHYLELRATALETDDYRASDFAWLDMKQNGLDLVIGPIENYEDRLEGLKNAHEAYVLIKDRDWSRRLARYAAFLPALQAGLPVAPEFKRERPGTDSDLNAYDAVFYAGQANAGPKTIAINLPNDEVVQLRKGTRRLQLKNVMRAKFDRILVPIADALIAKDQQPRIAFDAFFENTMFHEVAHGLGIKNTINGKGTVRQALKERNAALEEEKADVLGLYMVATLNAKGELGRENLLDNYVTFLASIMRSVRFGGGDAHGRANILTFNYLRAQGAFARDSATGAYRVNPERMRSAIDSLSGKILRLQGTGDYTGVGAFMEADGTIPADLQTDLGRLRTAGIPVDVVFEQQ